MKDPEERHVMNEDYLELKKRLKERNLEVHRDLMDRRRELEETFKPIVASKQQMARDIIKDLEPLTKDYKNRIEISRSMKWKRKRESKYGPLAARFYRNYLNPCWVYAEDGKPMIGDKLIDIVGDNIVIDDEVYIGTSGLWSLITDKNS